MKILVVATHPDDEVLGCGGSIARHLSHGDLIKILVVTRGEPEHFSPSQVEELRQELSSAHKVLGISDVHFLDFPAPKLDMIPNCELADGMAEVMRSFRPDVVYLPHRGDLHADHRAVYQAALVAVRPNGNQQIQRVLCYETLSETEWATPAGDEAFLPTVFVDISDYLERKLKSMACYRSQLKEPPHPRSLQSIEALARFRGGTAGFMAAEAFVLIREVIQ